MSEFVYIVASEQGEYEQVMTGIDGVFTDEARATEAADELRKMRAARAAWNASYSARFDEIKRARGWRYHTRFPLSAQEQSVFEAMAAEAKSSLPPEPRHVFGERFCVLKLPLDRLADEWAMVNPD